MQESALRFCLHRLCDIELIHAVHIFSRTKNRSIQRDLRQGVNALKPEKNPILSSN